MSADVARQAQLVPPLGSDLDRTFTALDMGFTAVRRLRVLEVTESRMLLSLQIGVGRTGFTWASPRCDGLRFDGRLRCQMCVAMSEAARTGRTS